jgi:LacI family gluconate utilization system Gnt-I transcriptional repressor
MPTDLTNRAAAQTGPVGRRPTMTDVANAAGVSPMTVSRALRGDPAAAPATRARIAAIAEELGYVPDASAAALSSRRSGFIAVTLPSLNNANFADTLRGVTEGLAATPLQILLGCTDYDTANEERLIASLLRRQPEAIVVTGGAHTPRARRILVDAAIPVIEMWDQPSDPIGHVVGFSNAEASSMMVRRLHEKGYRAMGFLGVATTRDTRGGDRLRGFRRTLEEMGLSAHRVVEVGAPPVTMAQGAQAMAELLDACPDVDAVLCVSDLSAMGALHACRARGLSVPRDVAVAGFGDFDIAAYTLPALTTIDVDARGIGRSVAEVMLGAIGPKSAPTPPRRLTTTIRIVERESA